MRKNLAVFLFCFFLAGAFAQNGRPSVALVLGGGAARGYAHIAVLELIEEMGIPVDMIAGVSAGAIVGGLYAAGYSPAMILETLERRDWASFFQDRPLSPFLNRNDELPLALGVGYSEGAIALDLGKGYSTGQRAYELFKSLTLKIPSYFDFDNLPIPFRAGTVEVPSGKFVFLENGDLAEAIRASMSIQGVFEPFNIDGKSYVDGGLLNNLPVREVREMGFDIVIAVDPFVPPENYDTSPMELPDLMTILYTSQMSKEHHSLADVVLFPLPADVPTADFSKGREIYALAREQREKLSLLLEPIREKIFAGINGGEPGYAQSDSFYTDRPPFMPQRMIIKGALKRDHSYIEKMFARLVMGKAMEDENVTAFLESVYETGNYRMAIVRTDLRSGEALLELILYPETESKFMFRSALDFEGTFSSQTYAGTALRGGIEFMGKDGFSLLLKASIMDELSLGLSILRPLGPHFFVAAEASLVREQELTVKGILGREETIPDRLLYFHGALKGGLRVNSYNSLSLWPEYLWFRTALPGLAGDFREDDQTWSIAGIAAAYTYSNLDHLLFPSRGFRLRLENHLRFTTDDLKSFDLVSVDLGAAIPLGGNFNIDLSAFVSSVFGDTELPPDISTFAFESVHRAYFPHASDIFSGGKRTALSLALRFEPLENLSILGGRLIFSLAVAAGRTASSTWADWADFGNDGLIWNASFGAALVPVGNFGLQIRAGAGGSGKDKPVPFVSLDIGMSVFQKRLF
ncbi:MAG: patatin-like phospholipase family protein [Treponema sp.]|jgi:NTE family protein|nr:patatin-like phospholipase family protein [Treponema sp.]